MAHITRETFVDRNILADVNGVFSDTVVVKQQTGATADIVAGTVMAKITSGGKYAVYDNTKTDGTEVAKGILGRTISKADIIAGDVTVKLYRRGVFNTSQLVGLDAAGLADLYAKQGESTTIL